MVSWLLLCMYRNATLKALTPTFGGTRGRRGHQVWTGWDGTSDRAGSSFVNSIIFSSRLSFHLNAIYGWSLSACLSVCLTHQQHLDRPSIRLYSTSIKDRGFGLAVVYEKSEQRGENREQMG